MSELDTSLAQRRLTRRTTLKLAAVGGVGAIFTSCFPGGSPSNPQGAPSVNVPPDTLTIAISGDTIRIPPLGPSSNILQFSITSSIYESLYHYKRQPDYPSTNPILATSWESVNPTTWRYHLRQGVKFHNGTPFTADSVLFTLQHLRSAGPNGTPDPLAGRLAPLDHIVAVDNYTVDFVTSTPWYLIQYQLNNAFLCEDRSYTTSPTFSQAAGMGTGPYKFVEWVKGDHVTLERNEDWWGQKPPWKRVTWRAVPEASTRVSALLAGEVDLINAVQPQDIDRINAKDGLTGATVSANGSTFSFLPNNGIYADQRFRQALNYALDRDAIIKGAMGGFGGRTNGNRAPGMLGADSSLGDYPYDTAKSMQLIKDSGYSGQPVNVYSSQGNTFKDAEIAQAIGGMFQKVGLKANVKLLEQGAYDDMDTNPSDGIYLQRTQNIVPDFENIMNDMTATDLPAERQLLDPRLIQIRKTLQGTVDTTQRIALAREGAARAKDLALMLLIATYVDGYGMKKSLGFSPRSDGAIWVREMTYKG